MIYRVFKDREEAAEELAEKIKSYLKRSGIREGTEEHKSIVVLAIPRGGVVTGDVIASSMKCDMDIIVSRKIGAETNSELAIGALLPDGTYFINERIAGMLNTSQVYIDKEVMRQKKEIERRLLEFRGNKDYNLNRKIVILVDDGIATGSTIIAAAKWIKDKHNCKKLIIAVPVAPATKDTIDKLNEIADHVIVLAVIEEFYAVGQFYQNFNQVENEEVKEILKKYKKQ